MKIKKSTLYIMGILSLIIVGGYFLIEGNSEFTGNVIDNGKNTDFQNVVLGIKNYNYYPNTVTVKSGKPVRISLDSTVSGCYRSFTIKSLGIAKNLPTPEDYIEFTPTKPGTYKFACSMGMGTGNLIVE